MDRVACRLHGLDGCGPRCVGSTHHLDFLANFKPALPQDFAEAKLWADTALQLVFMLAAVWGWLRWGRQVFSPGVMPMRARLVALTCACLCWLALYGLLTRMGGQAVLADAFVGAFSLVAQILMVRQRIEHWLFWLAANLMGVGLFWLQGLKATAGLYLLFALLALVGLRQWQRQLAINKASS